MTNSIICGNNAQVLAGFPADYIDLTVTSPPYDNLRDYNGYEFDFEAVAQQLYRVTKRGGVVVWVVGDATINGSETGASFRQALYFMTLGFNLYDTMFWEKLSRIPTEGRYYSVIEYMFVFSNGKPKSIHFINDHKNKTAGARKQKDFIINKGNNIKKDEYWITPENSRRSNLWGYATGTNPTGHPAPFPEALAHDHIISWSNPGDLILDPFCGSGTTLKMAKEQGRNYIGIDISPEYCELSRSRVEGAKVPLFVLQPETNGKPKQLELLPE